MAMTQDWVTRKQAAEWLQVHKDTVKKWEDAGLLVSTQVVPRGSVRISMASIERMLEKKTGRNSRDGA